MTAAGEQAQESLIEATSVSLMRVALAFGLTNALVPLIGVVLSGKPPLTVALAIAWVAAWCAAIVRPLALRALLEPPRTRWAFAAACVAATGATILLSGGIDSPLKNGANWVGWAATVVLAPRVALLFGALLGAGTCGALLISGPPLSELLSGEYLYTVVTALLNPLVIVLIALALAGVFRSLIIDAPQTLWDLRDGAPASTAGLTALLSAPTATLALPPATGLASDPSDPDAAPPPGQPEVPADGEPVAPLSAAEHDVLELLAAGFAVKQIGPKLGYAEPTIRKRIDSAKRKVGARTIEHLVAIAWAPRR